LDEKAQRSDAAAALAAFLSKLRRQMDDHDVAEITAVLQ